MTLMYLPKPMMDEKVCQLLQKHGSIANLYKAQKQELTEEEYIAFWVNFCELRINHDFEYFAYMYQTIEDGDTAEDIPFKLKRAQRAFLEILEDMRLSGEPIRAIVLKARQMGLSTEAQLYMEWIQSVHQKNWHSVICAHVKDSATNIRAMYDKVIENMPPVNGVKYTIAPFKQTQNIKIIPERGCRITIGSAEKPESVRGQNPKLAHFSEVAFYPDTTKKGTAQLIGSIVGSMKLIPLTVQIYESTANGVGDYFHTQWEKAKKGETVFRSVFLPWYFDERYSTPIEREYYYNHSGKREKGGLVEFILSMDEYERILFDNHPRCTLENIHWYRRKKSEMATDELMMQEYPSDDIEAFQDSGLPAFRAKHIEAMRSDCKNPLAIGNLEGDASPVVAKIQTAKRREILSNLRFIEDKEALSSLSSIDIKARHRKEKNRLRVWEYPDIETKVSNRYVVVFDPQKGISEKADFGVITVFDRYWMLYGGKPEVVAEWRGQIDKDITIWIAVQIAKFYNNALLVVESNTYDSDIKEDDNEFIFDTIAEYYDNLYSRTPADKIRDGIPAKYGFNTNKSTKPMVIANYVVMLREKGYIERNADALDEARVYEQKQNGSFGAKDGRHDDILMTRMIGCFICYELPPPAVITDEIKRTGRRMLGESSF
ncbi:hypothetical protein [Bacteroides reticulotermitis]|uniref:hypothetical protein n=1 Tax=Bacteroides reticulotermitis TaxID=1133319 RepID=UPI003A84347F